MKSKITIKHITLAVGIIVAVLAAMMFLVKDFLPLESMQVTALPEFSIPQAFPKLIETTFRILFRV